MFSAMHTTIRQSFKKWHVHLNIFQFLELKNPIKHTCTPVGEGDDLGGADEGEVQGVEE